MKSTRRDKKLDSLLGKVVRVDFTDGSTITGVLGWVEAFQPPLYMKPFFYYIVPAHGNIVQFRKTYVKKVEVVRNELCS